MCKPASSLSKSASLPSRTSLVWYAVVARNTRFTIPDLLGIAVWVIAEEIQHAKDQILMALADTLAELQAEDTELAADVTALAGALSANTAQIADLQQQIADLTAAGAGATPEQLAALQTVADDLANTHNAAVALVPPAA